MILNNNNQMKDGSMFVQTYFHFLFIFFFKNYICLSVKILILLIDGLSLFFVYRLIYLYGM